MLRRVPCYRCALCFVAWYHAILCFVAWYSRYSVLRCVITRHFVRRCVIFTLFRALLHDITQRSTECTSVAGHSSQHNITQHDILPQTPNLYNEINPLTPNNPYRGCTALLTSKRCILYIYSTNTGTEYFKHGINSPFFSLQNAVCFIILTHLVPVLLTFYLQSVLKLKKYIIPAPKG
jgi:hypothetical protein